MTLPRTHRLAAFGCDGLLTDRTIALLPVEQQQIDTDRPVWEVVAFAVAVFSGTTAAMGSST